MHSFVLTLNPKTCVLLILLCQYVFGQNNDADTINVKSPQTAAMRSFIFPGGGQYYNEQPIKGAVLTTMGLSSAILYLDYSKKYNDSKNLNQADKKNFLHQRNRYGWWIIIVYIYGLFDAIVEAHLHPFNKVKSEKLENPDREDKKEK